MAQLPNLLSLLRLLCAPLLAVLVLQSHYTLALALGIPIGITDWLDGYFARRMNVISQLGAYLDPAADKILMVVLLVCLALNRQIPFWLVWLVLGRDIIIVGGVGALYLRYRLTKFPPTLSGKVSTGLQILMVLAVLLAAAFPITIFQEFRLISIWVTTLLTAVSGIDYIHRGITLTRENQRLRRNISAGIST